MSWWHAFTGGTAQLVNGNPHAIWPQVEAWSTGQLQSIVWADILGLEAMPLTRAEAMMIPAVARARHLICTTIAALPLVVYRGPDPVPDDAQPVWAYGTDTIQSPYQRMLWTLDDLVFYGASLWEITATVSSGDRMLPSRMLRIPFEAWDVNTAGEIIDLDGKPYAADAVILIPGPHEGILAFGSRALRTAALLERSVVDVAASPFRLELHQITADILTREEISEFVAAARRALADNHGVLFTNPAIETKAHGQAAEQLLIEGRNASAVDAARLCNIPAAMVDANAAGASLTYETAQGRNQQFVDYSLRSYMQPVAARLSQDDVLPRGQRTAFDLTDFTATLPAPGSPVTQD